MTPVDVYQEEIFKRYLDCFCVFVDLVPKEGVLEEVWQFGSFVVLELEAAAEKVLKRHRKLVLQKL